MPISRIVAKLASRELTAGSARRWGAWAAANRGEAAARAAASWSEVIKPDDGAGVGLEVEGPEAEDCAGLCWLCPRRPVIPPNREPCWAEARAAASCWQRKRKRVNYTRVLKNFLTSKKKVVNAKTWDKFTKLLSSGINVFYLKGLDKCYSTVPCKVFMLPHASSGWNLWIKHLFYKDNKH